MKRSIATLFLLVLAFTATYAQTEPWDDSDAAKVDWQLLSSAAASSWWGFDYNDNSSEFKTYYYNCDFPSRLDSLKTTYNNQGTSYRTECYYYTELPEYRQKETLFFYGWYLPARRTLTLYDYDDRIVSEARYNSHSPDAPVTSLTEYTYDAAGHIISRIDSAPDAENPDVMLYSSGMYCQYNDRGLLAEQLYSYLSDYPSPYDNTLITYMYNSADLPVEITVATSADTLNWNLESITNTTYAMSFGTLKPAAEVYYTYDESLSMLQIYRSSTFTYEDNNRKVHASHLYPQSGDVGQDHYTYNQADKLLTHNYSSSGSGSGSEGRLTQTWNTPVTAADDPIQPPNSIRLTSYPNPFNPSTTIRYELPAPGNTVLELFNIRGQRVRTLFSGQQEAGQHSLALEADSGTMASGVYFLRLSSGSKTGSTKLLLMK